MNGCAAAEVEALVDFVRNGLLDPVARPRFLRRLVPERPPTGRAGFRFEFPVDQRPR